MIPYRTSSASLPYADAGRASLFSAYAEIAPVALIYGDGREKTIDVHNHAARLWRTLDRIGRERITLAGVFRADASLDRSSVRALCIYLHTLGGLSKFRAMQYPFGSPNRYGWEELQRLLNLRWVSR